MSYRDDNLRVLSEVEQRLEEATAELAALPSQAQAVAQAVEAEPTRRAFELNSKPAKVKAKRQALVAEVERLEAEVAARTAMEGKYAHEDLAKELDARRKRFAASRTAELEAWEKAASIVMDDLYAVFNQYADGVEAHSRLRRESEAEGILDGFPGALDSWGGDAAFAAAPIAVDFRRFIERIVDVALDPHNQGFRSEGGSPDPLAAVIPDRKGDARKVQVQGVDTADAVGGTNMPSIGGNYAGIR